MIFLLLQLVSINLFTRYDISTVEIKTEEVSILVKNKIKYNLSTKNRRKTKKFTIILTKNEIKDKKYNFFLKNGSIKINNKQKRYYNGEIQIFQKNKKLYIVQKLPLEDYVIRVINAEIGVNYSNEMIKAFYLVVKNYTISNLRRHRKIDSDLCDITHCQLYYGESKKNNIKLIENIVKDVKDELICYDKKKIKTVYSAICGPKRNSSKSLWKREYPYLKKGENRYNGIYLAENSKSYSWIYRVSKKDILKNLKIKNLQIKESKDGYVSQIEYLKLKKIKTLQTTLNKIEYIYKKEIIDAQKFKRVIGHTFGWGKLKSLQFKLYEDEENYIFKGYGSGNGVGFCIAEAENLAKLNLSYKDIIKFFFYNVYISKSCK